MALKEGCVGGAQTKTFRKTREVPDKAAKTKKNMAYLLELVDGTGVDTAALVDQVT